MVRALKKIQNYNGFTIVELLIVIVVIAILAAVVIVAYNGIIDRARESSVQADTEQNAKAMAAYQITNGAYAMNCSDAGVKVSSGNSLSCNASGDGQHFCVGVSRDTTSYYATDANLTPKEGGCSGSVGVANGMEFTAISTGEGSTCGVAGGKAYCWGSDYRGMLGNGAAGDSSTPSLVGGALAGKTVTDIAVGDAHGCAIADGAVFCWGKGSRGQLGNGATDDTTEPVAVTTSGVLAGKTVSKVAVNGDQTCVVADGKAYCFGDTYEGALGNGVTARTNQTTPIAVDASGVLAGKTVTDITVGGYYAYYGCVIADGKAYCWGINTSEGRLGDGSTANRPTPVAVSTSGVLAGKTVTDISAYEYHVCVVADGGAYCWGGNGNGSLGNGTTNISTTPVAVTSTGVLAGKTVTAVAAGDYHTCGIASGKAYCWGDSSQGTLGNGMSGPIANQLTPVPVSVSGVLSGKTVTAIASGYNHTCVIADRLPHCWGDTVNWWGGVLGSGNTTGSNIPVLVSPIP